MSRQKIGRIARCLAFALCGVALVLVVAMGGCAPTPRATVTPGSTEAVRTTDDRRGSTTYRVRVTTPPPAPEPAR